MRARDIHRKYCAANEHEWLEIAAKLPRNSSLRGFCMGRAQQKGETWGEFSLEEWQSIEFAADAADVKIGAFADDADGQ